MLAVANYTKILYEMKPYIKLFLFSIISLIVVSCKNNGEKSAINDTDSTQENFTSPDLSLFQLKGHVKKCIIPGDDMGDIIYEFNEEGNLIIPKYEKIERDKNGAIIEYYDPETECTTRIKWEDGKVIGNTDMYGDGINSSSIGYEYDKENNIVQLIQEGITFPTNYSNYKFDEFGNWISRMVEINGDSYEEKRYITYYNSEVGQDSLLEYYKQKKEEEIQRDLEQDRLAEERRQEEKEPKVREITIEYTAQHGKVNSVKASHGYSLTMHDEDIISDMIEIPQGKKWIFKGINEDTGARIITYSVYGGALRRDKRFDVSTSTRETYQFYSGDKIRVAISTIIPDTYMKSAKIVFTFIEKSEYD